MKCLLFSSLPHFHFPFYVFLASITLPLASSDNKEWKTSCSVLFNCGSITGVDYPFWGSDRPKKCGYPGLKLNCEENIPMIQMLNMEYRVLDINPDTKTLKIARKDFMEGLCLKEFTNTTLDFSLFDYAPSYGYLTFLYGCPPFDLPVPLPGKFTCPINGTNYKDGYVELGVQIPAPCYVSVVVPTSTTSLIEMGDSSRLNQVIAEGFDVEWKVDSRACSECKKLDGQCGYDDDLKQFTCLCPNKSTLGFRNCSSASSAADERSISLQSPLAAPGNVGVRKNVPLTIGLAILGAAVFGIGLGWCIFSCKQRRKRLAAQSAQSAQTVSKDLPTPPSSKGFSLATPRTNFSGSIPSYPSFSSKNSDLEKGSTYFGVQVFSYAELEEATDNFNTSRELGEGGFGTVYFGKLHDDRIVAVKRLYENNFKRVEQFMNEVEILTRLRHQNLVTLYGCTSRRSRELLLVYEYIPNGTVADHLHGKRANSGLLSWPVRLSIAIETASALAYLHASDIIHRDVKTNNILLDNDFHVKVADFGLSRLFPTDATHVSTAPQGTPGYVDPEYYQCYQLTDKSDVYSFGVVLIELISSKQAVDTNRHRHDINLANMAVNKIQNHTLHELVDLSLGFETNNSVRRMTTLVGELAFRCLQQEKDMRPSMEEVLNALKGIENEELSVQKPEVLDIMEDDVRLLKVKPPQLSPDSAVTEKWVSCSTTPNSSG